MISWSASASSAPRLAVTLANLAGSMLQVLHHRLGWTEGVDRQVEVGVQAGQRRVAARRAGDGEHRLQRAAGLPGGNAAQVQRVGVVGVHGEDLGVEPLRFGDAALPVQRRRLAQPGADRGPATHAPAPASAAESRDSSRAVSTIIDSPGRSSGQTMRP